MERQGLENQPEAQAARAAGAADVRAVQALNQNAHNGSAGGEQNESIEIVMPKNGGGYDVLASRLKVLEKPEEPAQAAEAEPVTQLMALTDENTALVEKFLREIDTALGTKSEISVKEAKDILDKANRPSIMENKDWFDVEHVGDSFRFKTPVESLNELPRIVELLKRSGFEIVKLDLEKLIAPKARGWRMAAIDLRAPNGQILEYQILPQEISEAGKKEHQMYKRVRSEHVSSLSHDEKVELMDIDKQSRNLYQTAWEAYLKRTKQTEKLVRTFIERAKEILEK
ncbi:MAG: hypothetical protein LCH63_20550 [Candidatus Melainabacteria bacterium]|nr:hypothetical protein [Candidatus Melainabacteria bacterium]